MLLAFDGNFDREVRLAAQAKLDESVEKVQTEGIKVSRDVTPTSCARDAHGLDRKASNSQTKTAREWVFTLYFNLSLRWSATRNALAIMVNPGFTEVLETKKLPSTT